MKKIKCRECGETIEFKYSEMMNEEMKFYQECFLCLFWNTKIRMAEDGNEQVVRIDGKHYHLGDAKSALMINGGESFREEVTIEFFDKKRGRIKTIYLYNNGEIPERFRDRLPDNAKFIQNKKRKEDE